MVVRLVDSLHLPTNFFRVRICPRALSNEHGDVERDCESDVAWRTPVYQINDGGPGLPALSTYADRYRGIQRAGIDAIPGGGESVFQSSTD